MKLPSETKKLIADLLMTPLKSWTPVCSGRVEALTVDSPRLHMPLPSARGLIQSTSHIISNRCVNTFHNASVREISLLSHSDLLVVGQPRVVYNYVHRDCSSFFGIVVDVYNKLDQ